MSFRDMFRPKYKHSDPRVRLESVKNLTDEEKLIEIVKNDENSDVILMAFKQIENIIVRKRLIENITNQQILINIAKNDKSFYVRVEAIKKITDQDILFDIAKNNGNSGDRIEAVKKITDQDILFDIAKNDINGGVRIEAVGKITNQNALIDIAKRENKYEIRSVCYKKIKDKTFTESEKIIEDIVRNDPESEVRIKAVSKITDQDLLVKIAKKDKDKRIRNVAINKIGIDNITDKDILKFINQQKQAKEYKEKQKIEEKKKKNEIWAEIDWRERDLMYDENKSYVQYLILARLYKEVNAKVSARSNYEAAIIHERERIDTDKLLGKDYTIRVRHIAEIEEEMRKL